MNKIYKYGFLSVCGVCAVITLYFAAYGAVNRAEAFATWMNGGMDVHDARCAMAFGNVMEIKEK